MLKSASEILNHYLNDINRFKIYSIEMQRGESWDDLYYLCNVYGSWFIVFETDYVDSLAYALKEAIDIFESDDLKITHWQAKKDGRGMSATLSLDATEDKLQRAKIILDPEGTYLRYAVLAVQILGEKEKRYHPATYGNVTY